MRCQPEPRVSRVPCPMAIDQWSKLDTDRLISAPKVGGLMMRTPCLGFRPPLHTTAPPPGNYATHLSLKGLEDEEYTWINRTTTGMHWTKVSYN